MYFGELSEVMKYVILISESFLVVALSIIFYLLIHKTRFGKIKWIYQQVIIGVVFGGAAIFGTELGIDIGSSIINVRDAAPLAAGLIFGGPAGMIAAIIGSLERILFTYAFHYPYFPGYYAMTACCIATLLAGVYAWVLRKWFFENKTPNFLFGFATAAIMEVLHFIILYLTHISDPQTVLDIIYEITMVMIIANGVGVSLACLAMGLFENGFSIKIFKSREKTINSRIQLYLLILILVTGFTSTSFVVIIQNSYASETAANALYGNIQDLGNYVNEQTDALMLEYTANAGMDLKDHTEITDINERLTYIKNNHRQMSQINIIAFETEDGHQEGEILYSTDANSISRNVLSSDFDEYFSSYHKLFKEHIIDEEVAPEDRSHREFNFIDSEYYAENVKVGVFSLKDPYYNMNAYIQVVSTKYDFFHHQSYLDFDNFVDAAINELTKYRRVYLTGYLIVLNDDGDIVSNHDDIFSNEDINITLDDVNEANGFIPGKEYQKKIFGVTSFYMYDSIENYSIVSVIPRTDVTVGRNMMIIVYSFMLTFIYASIFFVTYILMKQLVIKNLRKINNTLNLIIRGDLDQKVEVKNSQEFIDLSHDINITVDTLKDFIKEAEERIDKELAFAKTIQTSSLPSVFPPFPGLKEFDIYATMNTAKEVGGDFYDFYFLDMDHFAFLVADVSGKGIPASMFMMESKALIKNTLTSIKDLEMAFSRINESLSQGNEANMFVTCWFGIVDMRNGGVEFINAGHNAPIIFRKETNKWAYIEESRDLVLAGMPNTKYHKQKFKLNPGDKLFLYTDGVTEATRNDKALYGEARLLSYLNKIKKFDVYKVLEGVQKDIDKFVDGAPQFDDITMLVFDLKEYRN